MREPSSLWHVDARDSIAADEQHESTSSNALLTSYGASRERVREAVRSALTPRQRLAVELHFFEGLSQSEIGRRLGISQQVVHKSIYGVDRRGKRIGGALAKLRRALSQPDTREV